MIIKIGLFDNNNGFETVLDQEGINFEKIRTDINNDLNEFVLLIAENETVNTIKILNYIKNGGLFLTNSNFYAKLFNLKYKKIYKKYLIASENSLFKDIGLVDLFSDIMILNNLKYNILDDALHIFYQNYGNGYILVLPFSVNALMSDIRFQQKKVYDNRNELPSEVVATVSKSKIREIIQRSLFFLLSLKKIPLVRKTYIPKNSLFIFRVDTDFCNWQDALELYQLCQKYNICATWFVDTVNEDIIKKYLQMHHQEIGLHCFRHLVFKSYDENYQNIQTGLKILHKYNIYPQGFASPFGEWNENLQKAVENSGFSYSSDFAYDYDDLPLYPLCRKKKSDVLQIPVHPISLGRLRRSHYSKNEMISYFIKVMKEKIAKNEPVILYHHPHHKMFDIIEEIFQFSQKNKMQNLTMNEYRIWWQNRKKQEFVFDFNVNFNKIKNCGQNNTLFPLLIDFEDKKASNISNNEIELSKLNWTKISYFLPKDLKRIRKWHWRDWLYRFEKWKGKRKL